MFTYILIIKNIFLKIYIESEFFYLTFNVKYIISQMKLWIPLEPTINREAGQGVALMESICVS